jgi:nucleoside-diphosphate-sugar epimerase
MRIVIVGATGNIGTTLVRFLRQGGNDEVIGLARRRDQDQHEVDLQIADIATDDLTPHFRGADAVVHLAWLFQPTHRPAVTWEANVIGTSRLLRAVAATSVPTLVYLSSIGAYSPAPGRIVDETWPTHSLPSAAYGREKAYVERLLDAFEAEQPQVRVIRFRPAFVFQALAGTEQRRLFAGPLLPRTLVRPGRLPVLPWPAGLRFQALHADDVATAIELGLRADASGAFNLAAEPVIDGAAVASLLASRYVPVPPVGVRTALAAAWHSHLVPSEPALFDLVRVLPLMNTDRARSQLGWAPQHSATDALAATLEGMRAGNGTGRGPLAPDSLLRRIGEIATGVGKTP